MKTKPTKLQKEARERLKAHPDFYYIAGEQGTGKTWMCLDDIERKFNAGEITGALIIAPNGVHINWIYREVPMHLEAAAEGDWFVAGAGKKRAKKWERLFNADDGKLKLFAINIDAIIHKSGFDLAHRFLKAHRAVIVLDEAHRIKTPTAARTKAMMRLRPLAQSVRLGSGTPMPLGPPDLFSQFKFMSPEKALLGTTSYRAFVAEFAKLAPADSPLVTSIMQKSRSRFVPQIIETDSEGRKCWRNLDKLRDLISPYMFRVSKDALKLPPKVYEPRYFELEPKERQAYDRLFTDCRHEFPDGETEVYSKLAVRQKLRQASSGFLLREGVAYDFVGNTRMKLFKDVLEDLDGQFIVWAVFKEELRRIEDVLRGAEISFVTYHGDTPKADRIAAIDVFQAGKVRCFLANPQAAGIGTTLTAAKDVVYYSNTPNYEHRAQSEDRAHRKGTAHTVRYIDLVALGTVDEFLINNNQLKEDVSREVLGDTIRDDEALYGE